MLVILELENAYYFIRILIIHITLAITLTLIIQTLTKIIPS